MESGAGKFGLLVLSDVACMYDINLKGYVSHHDPLKIRSDVVAKGGGRGGKRRRDERENSGSG